MATLKKEKGLARKPNTAQNTTGPKMINSLPKPPSIPSNKTVFTKLTSTMTREQQVEALENALNKSGWKKVDSH
jgi:hypothetical protein